MGPEELIQGVKRRFAIPPPGGQRQLADLAPLRHELRVALEVLKGLLGEPMTSPVGLENQTVGGEQAVEVLPPIAPSPHYLVVGHGQACGVEGTGDIDLTESLGARALDGNEISRQVKADEPGRALECRMQAQRTGAGTCAVRDGVESAEFGLWQTAWKRHARFAEDGVWDQVLTLLLPEADTLGELDWQVLVDSTIARAHQHGTNTTREVVSNARRCAGGSPERHESSGGTR